MILVCAHAGLKTGEDGPTHADPQALQLLQENFPRGTAITLTPWDPQEIWPLLAAALAQAAGADRAVRDAAERDGARPRRRSASRRPRRRRAASTCCASRAGAGRRDVVLQESAVAYAFVEQALPLLEKDGHRPVRLLRRERRAVRPAARARSSSGIFPEERAREAMGITGFTLPTMYRWVRSDARPRARRCTRSAKGHFLGSGQGAMVLAEAGLDGESQSEAILRYVATRKTAA